jgi:hypothetical protein
MPNFTFIEDQGGDTSLLNLDQIRMITEIRDGHCKIVFGYNFTVELDGDGAEKLIARLLAESELIDGTPMAEMVERFKQAEKSTQPKVIPFDGSESQS